MSNTWKNFEREVAKFFGGKRRIRVSYSESCEDVLHEELLLECKYGKQIPRYLRVKAPTRLKVGTKSYMLCPSAYLEGKLRVPMLYVNRVRKSAKYLREGLTQAAKYRTVGVPVLCVKPPRCHGFVACWDISEVV